MKRVRSQEATWGSIGSVLQQLLAGDITGNGDYSNCPSHQAT